MVESHHRYQFWESTGQQVKANVDSYQWHFPACSLQSSTPRNLKRKTCTGQTHTSGPSFLTILLNVKMEATVWEEWGEDRGTMQLSLWLHFYCTAALKKTKWLNLGQEISMHRPKLMSNYDTKLNMMTSIKGRSCCGWNQPAQCFQESNHLVKHPMCAVCYPRFTAQTDSISWTVAAEVSREAYP